VEQPVATLLLSKPPRESSPIQTVPWRELLAQAGSQELSGTTLPGSGLSLTTQKLMIMFQLEGIFLVTA